MIGGIIALVFGVLAIVMCSQPVIGIYGEALDGSFNVESSKASVFDFINFEGGTYQTAASVFIILSLVFAGIMLLLTLVNLIARASNNKSFIGAKVAALMFFLCMLVTVIMVGMYCINDMFAIFGEGGKEIWDGLRETGTYVTVGWGLLVAFGSSLLCLIFAPRKKK